MKTSIKINEAKIIDQVLVVPLYEIKVSATFLCDIVIICQGEMEKWGQPPFFEV